jgi:MFS family permease
MSAPAPISITDDSIYGRTFWLAYIANTLLVLANSLTFRFAELVVFLGGTEERVGDIVAIALTISVVVRLSVSHVLDDYGTRRMWPLCTLLFIGGCAMFLQCRDLSWTIYAARTAFVVGLTGMFACSMTHIQNVVPPHRRTEVIGNLGSSGFIGIIVGSNVGDGIVHAIPPGRTQFVVLFGGALIIGIVYLAIILALTSTHPVQARGSSPPAFRLLSRHWPGMVVLVSMVMGLGVTVTTVFLTRFATSRHIDGIGMFFTGYALSAFAFRILAAKWSRTIGRHWMLVRGLMGHAAGHFLLSFADSGWEFILPSIVCGFGHALLFPAVVSLGAGAFPATARGSGTAIILGFTDFGSLVVSPLLGRIIVTAGFQTMFWTSSLTALIVGLIYAAIAMQHLDAETDEARANSVAAELD